MNTLLEMFRDTAIKTHIGFKHEGPWEQCEWIECEDRRNAINQTTIVRVWTDEFPSSEETFYWMRHKLNHADINVGLLRDRTLLLAEGSTWSKSPRKDYEYLPASPSDAEQLIELRKAAIAALPSVRQYALILEHPDNRARFQQIADNLYAALNPKQPEKETQSK